MYHMAVDLMAVSRIFLKGTHGSDPTSILTLKCTIKARLPSWVLSIQLFLDLSAS